MKLIVGLGNPGSDYCGTRHNVGFMVVEKLAQRWSIALDSEGCRSKIGKGEACDQAVCLAQPQTWMNRSGEAARCLLESWSAEPTDMLVICDDLSLPLGMIRLRAQGSDGGHLGLSDILAAAGSEAIPRLRVGIQGAEAGQSADWADYVLKCFLETEKGPLAEGLTLATEAAEAWLSQGMTAAMNQFNQKVKSE